MQTILFLLKENYILIIEVLKDKLYRINQFKKT